MTYIIRTTVLTKETVDRPMTPSPKALMETRKLIWMRSRVTNYPKTVVRLATK